MKNVMHKTFVALLVAAVLPCDRLEKLRYAINFDAMAQTVRTEAMAFAYAHQRKNRAEPMVTML